MDPTECSRVFSRWFLVVLVNNASISSLRKIINRTTNVFPRLFLDLLPGFWFGGGYPPPPVEGTTWCHRLKYFYLVLNPAVSDTCPFCGLRETVFHIAQFSECPRLTVFFSLLTLVFSLLNVFFSEKVFIFGAGYKKSNILSGS